MANGKGRTAISTTKQSSPNINDKKERKPLPPPPSTKPEQVDREYYEKKITNLTDEIKTLQNTKKNIDDQISGKTEGKEEFFRRRDLLRSQIDEHQRIIQELENQKVKAQEGITAKQTEGRNMKFQVFNMQKKLEYKTEKAVEDKITELEYKMHTETLTLKMEKQYIKQIGELKQSKPEIKKFDNLKAASGVYDSTSVGPLKATLEGVKSKILEARAAKQKLCDEHNTMVEERNTARAGMSGVFNEREKIRSAISAKIAEINVLREERSKKWLLWSSWVADQKAKRVEKEKEEKDAKLKEEEAKRLEAEIEKEKEVPLLSEIELALSAIKYCKNLLPKPDVVSESAKTEVPAIEGTEVLVAKKDRAVEYYHAPTASKKKNKVSKKATGSIPYRHDINTLSLFADMKVNAPYNQADIPKCISDLEKHLEDLYSKQKIEYENREKKRAEREKEMTTNGEDAIKDPV